MASDKTVPARAVAKLLGDLLLATSDIQCANANAASEGTLQQACHTKTHTNTNDTGVHSSKQRETNIERPTLFFVCHMAGQRWHRTPSTNGRRSCELRRALRLPACWHLLICMRARAFTSVCESSRMKPIKLLGSIRRRSQITRLRALTRFVGLLNA